MEKEKKDKKPPQERMLTIEKLGIGLDPAIFAGVCAHNNWAAGKRVNRTAFKQAVKKFLSASAGSYRGNK